MFGLDNLWLEIPLFLWVMFQIPAAIVMATRVSETEFIRSLLVLPLLWEYLRDEMNLAGTIIATIVITVLFLPALLVVYLMWALIITFGMIIFGFKELFRRRDK